MCDICLSSHKKIYHTFIYFLGSQEVVDIHKSPSLRAILYVSHEIMISVKIYGN